MMKRLSIIIPVYNAAPYIQRCLLSLQDQDIPENDYEIICINDGSTDNSAEIIEEWAKKYANIILINQENKGVSRARNKGMDYASGKYMMMLDADDFLQTQSLKMNLDVIEKLDLEMGLKGYIILDKKMKEIYRYDPIFSEDNVMSGIGFYNKYRRGKIKISNPHTSCGNFFKTSFLNSNELRYLADVPYLEDGQFMAKLYCRAKKVKFINKPFYYRTIVDNSATNSDLYFSKKARNGFLKSAKDLLEFKNNCKSETEKTFMNQPIIHFIILYLTSYKYQKNPRLLIESINVLKNSPLKKLDTDGCSDFYKRMGDYYNISIHYFYLNWLIFRLKKSLCIRWNNLAGPRIHFATNSRIKD